MDTLRGNFDSPDYGEADRDYDYSDEESGRELPPAGIGTDERRMQVRAYNHWAGLLDERTFPSIEDLHPENLPDFGPYSVLLDFTSGVDNPAVPYLGVELAVECDARDGIETLADVPARSLLSRITDHYMQILANQAPIGFEAEFVNQRGATILYRGILLPFSSDDDTIDFIYGVINWKELADQHTTDELMLEIDQALDGGEAERPREPDPVTDWADGPSDPAGPGEWDAGDEETPPTPIPEGPWRMAEMIARQSAPRKAYAIPLEPDDSFPVEVGGEPMAEAGPSAIDVLDHNDGGLAETLAAARQCADAARNSEDRTRGALYAAVSRAYDVSLAASEAPEEFARLVSDHGLKVQERAPMTPVVKLVFGADYDKTRLTEYAAALSHARRLGLPRGALADFLAAAEGGLKGVVKTERQLRREDAGQQSQARKPREKLMRKLRALPSRGFEAIAAQGEEFGLVVIRRMDSGEVAVLGEVSGDEALVERAARHLAN
ncbi:PAS domain-containing protein [Pelagerythrobacter marensis]|uniref:Uncharacterized protein n=1 Tax=Pelagerythrobacter marensis TaxID=543877 RepID=A0A0G3X9X0_9SPHN|nr:hypothetical protein [Pelagerythrobacter marensis]AKM08350.1 hypothetical protein AM2010_2293 [Pelagerythrobacter marensis]